MSSLKLFGSWCTIYACLTCMPQPGWWGAMKEAPAALAAAGPLRLPLLTDDEVPATGAPIAEPRIASGFFGCWEGSPGKFASIDGARGSDIPSGLRRVVKCYMPGQVETREFDLEFSSRHALFDKILRVLGLGSRRVRINETRSDIYEINDNQIYSRGTIKLELTESSLFKWPRTTQHAVVDEEVATLVNPDLVSIAGRAFVTAAQRSSVGVWSANLHH